MSGPLPKTPCPKCGEPVAVGSAFCGKCGAALTAEAASARSNPAATTPMFGVVVETGSQAGVGSPAGPPTVPRPTDSNEDLRARIQAAVGDSYKLLEMLGRGGMGVVFRARELALDREVALKVLSLDPRMAPDAYERFEREAKLAASLDHPNIVPIFNVGQRNGVAYYTMRLVRGGSVEDLIEQQRKIDVQRTIAILRDVAAALDYAHGKGIVHRDIKPANIMIGDTGHATVADFGIAKALGAQSGQTTGTSLIGSPGYMSPEQWRSEEISGRADQYALAIVAFEMLTGGRPFQALKIQDLVKLHLHQEPPDIATRRPGLEPVIDTAIRRALAKNPASRFPTATAFVDALAGGSARGPISTARGPRYVPAPAPEKRSRVAPLLVLLIPIAAAAAVLGNKDSRLELQQWMRERTARGGATAQVSETDSLVERDVAAVLADTQGFVEPLPPAPARSDVDTGPAPLTTASGVVVDTSMLTRTRPVAPRRFESSYFDVRVFGGAAQIRVDGQGVGFSNRIVRVEPGTHIVSVLGDFWPSQREVAITEGDTLQLNFYAPGTPRPANDSMGLLPRPD